MIYFGCMYVQNVVMFVEHSVMGTCNAFFEFQKRNFTKSNENQ